MKIILPYRFKPRPYQLASSRAFFIHKKRFSIDIFHRRAGKTKGALNFLLTCALQRVGTYFHTFPELTQARRVIWNGIDKEGKRYIDHIPRQLIKGNINNTDMRINLINGSSISLAGADRYDSLMGSNPAGIVFDEYSLQNPYAWHYLSPVITENGGWAKFIFTPRSENHGYELYKQNLDNPNWFVQKLDITETKNWDGSPIITEAMIDERRREGMPEELIQQEFFCSFTSALTGAYYSKEFAIAHEEERIVDFKIDFTKPIHTAWDIGRRDANSIWMFQYIDGNIYLINYYQDTMKSMEHYIRWLNDYARANNAHFGMHFAPHDIRVGEYSTGKQRIDHAADLGFYFKVVPKISVMDGIDAVKRLFPSLIFHQTNCMLGIQCLKQYQKGANGLPQHDFASHPGDSLRYLAVGWYDEFDNEHEFQPFTLNQWHP